MSEEIRIGVFVCHCGINIANVVNVPEVVSYALTLPHVKVAQDSTFTCSAPGQNAIKEAIIDNNLNRVVIAACSPQMHEITFQNTLRDAGLNPHLLEIANIREHVSWVHQKEPEKATEKAKILVQMAVAKTKHLTPIEDQFADVTNKVLIVGGGIAGLRASLDLARVGFHVDLVEKKPVLGGHSARIGKLAHNPRTAKEITQELINEVLKLPNIDVFTNSELTNVNGAFGDYEVTIETKPTYVSDSCGNPEEGERVCPVEIEDEYNYGLTTRKAFFKPYPDAIPLQFLIDMEKCTLCGDCVQACDSGSVDLHEKPTITEREYGTIIVSTGYSPYTPKTGEYGFGEDRNVITLIQLERILADEKLYDEYFTNTIRNIVFIGCVGSMQDPMIDGNNTYCSRMCCSSSFKNMIELKERIPSSNIYFLYRDIRTYARRDERLYEQVSELGVILVKYKQDLRPLVHSNGNLKVQIFDSIIQKEILIPSDIIVLANGMEGPKDFQNIREILKLSCSDGNFVKEAHAKLRPVEVPTPGIYVAGAAQAPKDIIETVTSASAAASKSMIPLIKGKVPLQALQSKVDEEICGGCRICISTCPYNAISRVTLEDKREVARVDSRLCQACGACAAACPSGAMQQIGFTDNLLKEMIAVMEVPI